MAHNFATVGNIFRLKGNNCVAYGDVHDLHLTGVAELSTGFYKSFQHLTVQTWDEPQSLQINHCLVANGNAIAVPNSKALGGKLTAIYGPMYATSDLINWRCQNRKLKFALVDCSTPGNKPEHSTAVYQLAATAGLHYSRLMLPLHCSFQAT
jgi:hypothetical protein